MKQKSTPLQGPWYYVYLAPRWALFCEPSIDQDHSIGHSAFWAQRVAPAVAKHYKISDKPNLKRLSNIPYSMPRGRVCFRPRSRQAQEWVVYFGDDWPTTLKAAPRKTSILKAFNLVTADWVFDEHEVRLKTDERAFSTLTGSNAIRGGRGGSVDRAQRCSTVPL